MGTVTWKVFMKIDWFTGFIEIKFYDTLIIKREFPFNNQKDFPIYLTIGS